MVGSWYDIESLEELHQDEAVRDVVLRTAVLGRGGRLRDAVHADVDLDAETKTTVLELAGERAFLLAFEDYARRCRHHH
ncbi:MAG: hypothetical protein ACRDOS_16425 [Gaiellaceae bacterium]